jgi:hypothetical protein
VVENVLRLFLEVGGDQRDTATVARQAAEYLAGRHLPVWEHVVIDIGVPVPSIAGPFGLREFVEGEHAAFGPSISGSR